MVELANVNLEELEGDHFCNLTNSEESSQVSWAHKFVYAYPSALIRKVFRE